MGQKVKIETPKEVIEVDLENVEMMLRKLDCISGCRISIEHLTEFKSVDDVIATLTDPGAYEYPCNAPSAQMFLTAIALMSEICMLNAVKDIISDNICEKFSNALGLFVATNDARAFLILDPSYSD